MANISLRRPLDARREKIPQLFFPAGAGIAEVIQWAHGVPYNRSAQRDNLDDQENNRRSSGRWNTYFRTDCTSLTKKPLKWGAKNLDSSANFAGMGPPDPRVHVRIRFPRRPLGGTTTDVVGRGTHNEGGTPMGTTRGAGIMTVVIAGAIAAAATARAGDELPRYRLEPGMELSYKGSSTFRHQNGMHIDDEETTAWVVRRNGDGSVRVVLRQGSRFTATSVADTLKSLFKKQDQAADGVPPRLLRPVPRRPPRAGRRAGLPHQPRPAVPPPARRRGAGEGRVGPARRADGPGVPLLVAAGRARRLGLPRRAGRAREQDLRHDDGLDVPPRRRARGNPADRAGVHAGLRLQGQGKRIDRIDRAWRPATPPGSRSFAPAADRYFAASKAYERATEEASKDAGKAEALLADAKAALQSARDAIDHPIFREQLDRQIAQHDGTARYYADSAKRRADVVGKPAADWELQGLDGKTHALAEYRGKVVVLDFWYRGCGWCIKAMPQLNALAEQFEGRPVAVLGMNTDRNEADAKFVADAMGLKYATLRAEGIPEKYGVQGVPDADPHRPRGHGARRPRGLLADPPGRTGEGDRGSPAAEMTAAAD